MRDNIPQRFSSFILHPSFFILLALCAFALAPLTAPGYFSLAHDARHSVYFLRMFDQSIRDGAWYPRWAADMVFGYGYPLWLILAPIPFFAGEAFHLVGLDFVSAVKLVDGLAFLGAALTMFLFASRVLRNKNAALVAAIAYAYIPYHLVDLYVRAAQAELVALVFPPLIFWAFHRLAETRRVRHIAIAALAYAGLILAHIQSAFLFTPVIGLYILWLVAQEGGRQPVVGGQTRWFAALRLLMPAAGALALALGIAAIFLLPILFEQRYLTSDPLIGGFFNYRKHFLNVSQLLSPFWGYGYAGEYGNDQFSLQLGLMPTLLALVALWALAQTRASRASIVFFVTVVAATIFAMLPVSASLWEMWAGVVAFTQFPWRLLIITTFALAFLAGAAMDALGEEARGSAPALAVALLFVTASYPYAAPQHTEAMFNLQTQMEFEVKYGELLGDTIWTIERPKTSPLVEQYLAGEKLTRAVALDEGAQVETLRYGGQSVEARVEARAPARVLFYTRYFPGWTAALDGQPIGIEPYGEQGLILARVPAGTHVLRLRFEDTPPRWLGAIISAISLGIALAMLKSRKG